MDPTTAKVLTITDIVLRTGRKPRLLWGRKYHIKFSSGNMLRLTRDTKDEKDGILWDEKLSFNGDEGDELCVEVYQRHRFPRKRDELVGSLISTFGDLMTQANNNGSFAVVEHSLRKDPSKAANSLEANFTLKFTLTATPLDANERQVASAVGTATQAVDTMRPTPVVDHATLGVGSVQMLRTTWDVLLQRTELFKNIVAGIVEIHPYASLAWSVVSSVNQVLVDPKNCDDRIIRLAGSMSDAFAFVHDTEALKAVQTRVEPIKLLIQQVMECSSFICDYVENEDFETRMVKYTFSDVDARIVNYQSKLHGFGDAFMRGVVLQTGIIVDRMQDVIEDTEKIEKSVLKDLPYADGARHDLTKGCLPGTRESILHEIYEILNNPIEDAPRVCLLTGVAGSGKSAVAHSIARWYESQDKLGSSYCFARADVVSRNPTNLFSTIARDLANRDRRYRSALCKIVEANHELCTSRVPMEQLERLIIEPSRDFRPIGPLIVVIDALDECGDRASRQHLLPALSSLVAEAFFPTNFRFLITARPEDDILDELPPDSRLVRKELGDISKQVVDADIEKFIHHSLDNHSSELQSVNQDWCRLLVRHSEHLFQWAATACNFIGGAGSTELRLSDRVRLLLETYRTEGGFPLDELYRTVLLQLFKSAPQRDRFREVMAVVLALNEPLPLPSLSALFDGHLKLPVDVRAIVSALASLLDGASNDQKPVRPLHASFYDFLRNTERSGSAFYIPILPQHSLTIGQASLACMRHMLKFNICDLTDSRILNTAILDLSDRVNRAIPPHLSYSCLYWMNHLQHTQSTLDLVNEVTPFFKAFFPYWIEAISLLSHFSASPISSALNTCTILQHWIQFKNQDTATLAFEASRFIQVFVPVLRRSTPHLYLSAMPQTPVNSPLHQLWLKCLLKHASITSGHPASWPADIYTLQGHEGPVVSVVYSPDGTKIASTSDDKTIRIWDVITGQSIASPFHGREGCIASIAYSPDGKKIASGAYDNTIRIWDAKTGQPIAGPFYGHESWVLSVLYSSDGKNIVSGSFDKTIRVWDAETGEPTAGPFMGHEASVASLAYSPNGNKIVSGSVDRTIRVWNIVTGQIIAGPFHGHEDWITSVAYSPDGMKIVSGSNDRTIRIWNATTGQPLTLLQGHDNNIKSVSYSPDGKRIVSGSDDRTIRIWDADTGQPMGGPLQGHEDSVRSVVYLPGGKTIVSGSNDKTIRIWDVSTSWPSAEPFQGHQSWITSVAYSPDGRKIVSGSDDSTIRIWNAITGEPMVGPFQGHESWITSIACSPDGNKIVSGSNDKTVRVWNAETGQPIGESLQGHEGSVRSVAYSPDGRAIVSGSNDKTIRIWDVATGQPLGDPLQGHTHSVTSVAYSPDGKKIVSGSNDSTIKIWDVTTGQLIAGPVKRAHAFHFITCVAFSPDGKKFVSGSNDFGIITVWDAATGEPIVKIHHMHMHNPPVTSVAYSPDGKMIVSGCGDNTIRIWDADTGQSIAGPFQGHKDFITSVAYSPDGNYIASTSVDQSIKVWKVQQLLSFDNLHEDDGFITSNDFCCNWIAPWFRHAFYLPPLSLVISHYKTYPIPIDNSSSGESWITCWKPES